MTSDSKLDFWSTVAATVSLVLFAVVCIRNLSLLLPSRLHCQMNGIFAPPQKKRQTNPRASNFKLKIKKTLSLQAGSTTTLRLLSTRSTNKPDQVAMGRAFNTQRTAISSLLTIEASCIALLAECTWRAIAESAHAPTGRL